jgi:hypothetical protein
MKALVRSTKVNALLIFTHWVKLLSLFTLSLISNQVILTEEDAFVQLTSLNQPCINLILSKTSYFVGKSNVLFFSF